MTKCRDCNVADHAICVGPCGDPDAEGYDPEYVGYIGRIDGDERLRRERDRKRKEWRRYAPNPNQQGHRQ